MLLSTSGCTAILFAVSAMAQTLNPWPQKNWGGRGLYTDGDINTVEEKDSPDYDGSFALLFNNWITMSGLYIQSSGDDFITDYKVRAVLGEDFAILEVGRVCGATGNFTFVPLINPRDGKPPRALTWLVEASGTKQNSTTYRINEMWPVFPGDEVVDPENTSPCPAAVSR